MKKLSCQQCNGQNLKAKLATYPIMMGEKQINIGRVSVRECLDCHELMPAEKGQEKIGIHYKTGGNVSLGNKSSA